MAYGMMNGLPLLMFVPLLVWAIGLYIAVRFLNAFERGVAAHERIAEELGRRTPMARVTD